MTVDEIVKLVIAFSLSFSIVGISWYVMRFLGTVTNMLEDTRVIMYQFSKIVEKVEKDYQKISDSIFGVVNPLVNTLENVSKPVTIILEIVAKILNRTT